jgi:hypothetical protein
MEINTLIKWMLRLVWIVMLVISLLENMKRNFSCLVMQITSVHLHGTRSLKQWWNLQAYLVGKGSYLQLCHQNYIERDSLQPCISISCLFQIAGQGWAKAWIAKSGKSTQKYLEIYCLVHERFIMKPCTCIIMHSFQNDGVHSETEEKYISIMPVGIHVISFQRGLYA